MRAHPSQGKRWQRSIRRIVVTVLSLSVLIALGFFALDSVLGGGPQTSPLREKLTWAMHSNSYKAAVLATRQPPAGQLRHVEWDGWGWAGMDTLVYLVYDPANALAGAAQRKATEKLPGLPCPVWNVQEMEPQWYSVRFYTDTYWDSCRK
jgi:hypothetical protein